MSTAVSVSAATSGSAVAKKTCRPSLETPRRRACVGTLDMVGPIEALVDVRARAVLLGLGVALAVVVLGDQLLAGLEEGVATVVGDRSEGPVVHPVGAARDRGYVSR